MKILVGDMLAFARPLSLDYQQGMITRLLEEVKQTANEMASRHAVTIRTELQNDMPVAEYDKHRLHQALLNLVNNSLEACPVGGDVLLTCQSRGGKIFIEISDNGNGIPPALRDDIFTPFVTTKKEETGLGLPIVQKIINAHKGSIDVFENSDKGVTFRIALPGKHGNDG